MIRKVSLNPAGFSKKRKIFETSDRPIVKFSESSEKIELSFIFPEVTISEDERTVNGKKIDFQEIGISGAGFFSQSGRPLLPSFGRFVQIPDGYDFEIEIKTGRSAEIKDIIVSPAQEEARDGKETDFEYDEEFYKTDSFYPDKIAECGKIQEMDGYKVFPVNVYPLSYNPEKKLIKGFSNITIIVKLIKSEKASDQIFDFDPVLRKEAYGNLIINPKRKFPELIKILEFEKIPIRPSGPEFLIIYDENLKKAAEKLENWKNIKGIRTEAVSLNNVGSSVNEIKNYIRGRRRFIFSRLRYVLLFGDTDVIPVEETNNNTTDHYYFTREDASSATDCLIPWVSGGRIPVSSLQEAETIVDQIIRYEQKPPCDPEYYRRMTFAAYFQDDGAQDNRADRAYMKTMETIRDHLVSIDFEVDRVYVTNNPTPEFYRDGTAVSGEVKNSIVDGDDATQMMISATSEGQMIIGHRDHGGIEGWEHPWFRNSHVENLMSAYPSVFFSINCLTGRFDSDPRDSFAEKILKMNGGAPSLIAATELSGTWRNDSMMKALFDAMWPGVIPTFPDETSSYAVKNNRLGDILNYAKSYLLVSSGTNSGVKDHFEIYHIIGDPTLEVWSEAPVPLTVKTKIYKDNLMIYLSSCPRGGVLTLAWGNRIIKRIEPLSTRLSIPLKEIQTKPIGHIPLRLKLYVNFAAPGYRFAQAKISLNSQFKP